LKRRGNGPDGWRLPASWRCPGRPQRDIYLTQIEKFKEKLNSYQDKLNNLKLDYPSIFHGRIIDGYYDIEISEQAEQKLQELNQYLSVNSFKEKFDSNNNLNLKGTHSN
jgi:hypothetical protein